MLRKDALELLKKEGCSEDIIRHSVTVSENALKVAKKINDKIDENVVEIGGLLHDIGRSKTNSVFHGIEGAKILKKYNIDPVFIDICKNHLGSGIEKEEAEKLAGKLNFRYVETSALTGENIMFIFHKIGEILLLNRLNDQS